MGVACLKFHGENFGCKIAKFVKVFCLESFPLCGTFVCVQVIVITQEMVQHGLRCTRAGCYHEGVARVKHQPEGN